jgi:hypothetical protein
MEAMYQQVPRHETQSRTVSVEVLELVEQFWEWVAMLPEGDEK